MQVSDFKRNVKTVLGQLEWRVFSGWRSAAPPRPAVRRLLILPCDATSIVGSKGDEAMIVAAITAVRAAHGAVEVGVLTTSPVAEREVRSLGYEPVDCRGGLLQFWPMVRAARRVQADLLLVLGADVMDGYYSPLASMRLLAGADLVARAQCPAVLLGFSFNAAPAPQLKPLFDGASPNLRMHLRDPASMERFRRFTRATGDLVADTAFMLPPDTAAAGVQAVGEWAGRARAAGQRVLAFNIHPMLFKNATEQQVAMLVDHASAALDALLAQRPVSVLLLSHDYRGSQSDGVCLAPVYERLQARWGERVRYPTDRFTAAQLKGIAGQVDAVATGRMHLAIAALGSGVPAAAFSYQDKFNGLFQHFGLPQELILAPQALDTASMLALLLSLVDDCDRWTAQVRQQLPRIRELSRQNLAEFLGPAEPRLPALGTPGQATG